MDKQKEEDMILEDNTGFKVIINKNILNAKGFILDYNDVFWSKKSFVAVEIN